VNGALLKVTDLRVDFGARAAVRDMNFELCAGETLGIVGESGSGKSTLARAVLRLQRSTQGSVEFSGLDLTSCTASQLRAQRRDLQIVFQDPQASLNPRMTVGEALAEPLKIFEPGLKPPERQGHIDAILERVGLAPAMAARYPHEFSGGQCQRIGIARAMILKPRLLVCDEPVSSLDVSIQGQIINLLLDLQRDSGMAMLFISHNLAVVRQLSHRVLVMYAGRPVEIGARDSLFASPLHPYTQALIAAARAALPSAIRAAASAEVPVSSDPQSTGCAFRGRCPIAVPICATHVPPLTEVRRGHWAACHRSHEGIIPLSFPA
jgi:oligopeptide transport system ATP-binding protein